MFEALFLLFKSNIRYNFGQKLLFLTIKFNQIDQIFLAIYIFFLKIIIKNG
jgi:hypothetical protein